MKRGLLALVLAPALALGPWAWASANGGAPLAGRIWVPGENRFAAPAEVERAVSTADYVLLGEEHPIARHHALQARLIRAAARDGRPAVVFEMVPRSRQAAIDAWRATGNPDAATFGEAVDWAESGWPDWSLYTPIVRAALARNLPLVAGGPDPDRLMAVVRGGLDALSPDRRRALGLDRALPAAARQRLAAVLRAVHCGVVHGPIERMLAIQRLRDASMAERMRASQRGGGVVLIAGHGHVRRDYGVPLYLRRQGATDILTIAFRAVGDARGHPRSYLPATGGKPVFDYVWFTRGHVPAAECNKPS